MQSGHRPKGRRLLFEFCARTPERAMRRGLLIVALGIGCKPSCEVKDLLLGVCGQGLKQCNDISQIVHDSLSLGRRPCRFGAEKIIPNFMAKSYDNIEEVSCGMLCPKCKTDMPDDAKFCSQCGRRLITAPPKQQTRRRGRGQGTARKRGSTWTAVWTAGFVVEDGKLRQIRHSKGGFATKTAALAYAANPPEKAEIREPTLSDYWQTYEKSTLCKKSDSKQTAHDIAWRRLKSIAHIPIARLTIGQLQEVVDANTKTHYPAKDMRTVLSHLYKRAVAEGVVPTNLAPYIELPPLQKQEIKPYTKTEIVAFWKAYADGDTFVGYILLMIYTGMMPGELRKLTKAMVDFDKLEIVGAGIKTDVRDKTPMVFPEIIKPVLQQLCETSRSRKGYVLDMNEDNFYAEFHAAEKRCGTRDLKPYSCRHTTATALAVDNVHMTTIKEIMRHSNISTTQLYIHPDTQAMHQGIDAVGKSDLERIKAQ